MTTRAEAFAGLSVALITPLRNGKVDYDRLEQQVEFQVEAGTTCLCPVGTTGESPTLSHDEHEQVISSVVGSRPQLGKGLEGSAAPKKR